jgi:hypothetical protein
VDHVALMGLENTGFAIANDKLLWIDPMDYRDQLAEAVAVLAASRVPVSVYNLPRCVLDRSVWPYAAQSISDWKNDFLPQCDRCEEKPRCSGFFTTGRPHYSRGIEPIMNLSAQALEVRDVEARDALEACPQGREWRELANAITTQ